MRILYVIGGYGREHLGGSIHHELAHLILSAGHEYEVFAPTHGRHMGGRSEEAVEDGVRVHRIVCAGRPGLDVVNAMSRAVLHSPWFLTSLLGLLRVLRRSRHFDVVLAESAYPLGAEVQIATRLHPSPFIVSVIGGDFIANGAANYGYGRYRLARHLMRRVFRHAAVVRGVSPRAVRQAEALGCPQEKCAVVQRNIARSSFLPHGADPSAFRAEARRHVAERFGIRAPRLVVAVGRLVPIKGFEDLIRALPILETAVGETQVLLVGPNRTDSRLGDYRRHLEALASALGVGPRIILVGALPHDEVRDALAAADAVAIPSIEEGGNKMVMEAAAVGTPVVATNTAGTGEWASAWGCALLVAPSDPGGLARGLAEVLGNPITAAAMGARGRLFAENFRPEVVAGRLLDLCRCAADGSSIPPGLRAGAGIPPPDMAAQSPA